ncbi:MAG: hypothetical protein K0S24_1387 [Sphingobacterium sp.]|jgi:hypothetical protein|nr:hypothetical protein [Sphingobacterium sp.]
MNKYAVILVIFITSASRLFGQSHRTEFYNLKFMATYDRVREAIPDLAARLNTDDLKNLTTVYQNDSSASFHIIERSTNPNLLVDNEKEYLKLQADAQNDPYKPSIYKFYKYEPKDKTASVIPPKKPLIITAYEAVWAVTIKKVAEKETNLFLEFKGETKASSEKIHREFALDPYYDSKIVNTAIDDRRIRNLIRDILLKELHVEQDNDPSLL